MAHSRKSIQDDVSYFSWLPDELVLKIVNTINPTSLAYLMLTNKRLSAIARPEYEKKVIQQIIGTANESFYLKSDGTVIVENADGTKILPSKNGSKIKTIVASKKLDFALTENGKVIFLADKVPLRYIPTATPEQLKKGFETSEQIKQMVENLENIKQVVITQQGNVWYFLKQDGNVLRQYYDQSPHELNIGGIDKILATKNAVFFCQKEEVYCLMKGSWHYQNKPIKAYIPIAEPSLNVTNLVQVVEWQDKFYYLQESGKVFTLDETGKKKFIEQLNGIAQIEATNLGKLAFLKKDGSVGFYKLNNTQVEKIKGIPEPIKRVMIVKGEGLSNGYRVTPTAKITCLTRTGHLLEYETATKKLSYKFVEPETNELKLQLKLEALRKLQDKIFTDQKTKLTTYPPKNVPINRFRFFFNPFSTMLVAIRWFSEKLDHFARKISQAIIEFGSESGVRYVPVNGKEIKQTVSLTSTTKAILDEIAGLQKEWPKLPTAGKLELVDKTLSRTNEILNRDKIKPPTSASAMLHVLFNPFYSLFNIRENLLRGENGRYAKYQKKIAPVLDTDSARMAPR